MHQSLPPRYSALLMAALLICARGAASNTTPLTPTLAGTYYSNPSNLEPIDTAAIATAAITIDFAAYTLTDQTVVSALAQAAARHVAIRIYLDHSEVAAECKHTPNCAPTALSQLVGVPGVTILVKRSMVLMHLKSYQLDGKLVRTGSANFSPLGEAQQDNSLTLSADPRDVQLFAAKFDAMWSRPDNLTLQQATAQVTTATTTRPHVH